MLKSFKIPPMVWDSGASAGLTPFHAGFIDYVECDIDVNDIGTTLDKFTATNEPSSISLYLSL